MSDVTGKATGLALIANYLDLNVDATENSVLTAVKTRINAEVMAKEKAEEELDKMKKKLDKMKSDYDEMKEKYDKACKDAEEAQEKAKKEKEEAEAKAKKAEEDSKKAQAKVKVSEYATAGRIKNEDKVVEKWVNLWVADPDGTKEILEAIPLNKTAATIATAGGTRNTAGGADVVDPNVVPMSAMHLQAKIQARINNKNK